MSFYKLNISQADLIGKFEYEQGKVFDPYITDGQGNYYVADDMYQLLKDTDQFKQLDFTALPTVTEIPQQDLKP